MTTDAQALALARRALPQEPPEAIQYALAVSLAEGTHYGDGGFGPEGDGSNNWGSVQEPHPTEENSFPHTDHDKDGKPYTGHFKRYPSKEAGFKDFAFTLLKPNVVEALRRGDGTAAAFAQHSNGYFELDPTKYAARVEGQYLKFIARTGEPQLLRFPAPPASAGGAAGTPGPGAGLNLLDAAIGVAFLLGTAWVAENLGVTPNKGPK